MAFFNEFPHTRTYDSDLGWLIRHVGENIESIEELQLWAATHKEEYDELKNTVDGLVNSLVDVIVPWDSSIAYHIFSIVEYQGTNYIAIQDVPVGVMITNTDYWSPANTVVEQINAIGLTVSDISETVENIPTELYPRRAYHRPEEYGAVVNDTTVDNGPFIRQAIIAANADGGIVLLSEGIYYCTTPINITERLMGVKIIGTGGKTPINPEFYGDCGTVIDYNGSGVALHFSAGGWGCEFTEFAIVSSASGIKFSFEGDTEAKNRITHSMLHNVFIYSDEIGLEIDASAYFNVENCIVHYKTETTPAGRTGIYVKSPNTDRTWNEYLTFKNIAVSIGHLSNATILPSYASVGMCVENCTHCIINNIDITDADVGLKINPIYACGFLNITGLDIARCHYGFYVHINGVSLQSSYIEQLIYTAPDTPDADDRMIRFVKTSGGSIVNAKVTIKDATIRTGTNILTYWTELDDNTLSPGQSGIEYNVGATPKESLGNNYRANREFSTLLNLSNYAGDLNEIKRTGMFPQPIASNAANGPGFACFLLVFGSPTYISQMALPMASASSFAFRVYNVTGGNWGSWQTMAKT